MWENLQINRTLCYEYLLYQVRSFSIVVHFNLLVFFKTFVLIIFACDI